MGDSMAWPMVDTMPSFMALGMASSMDPSMASPMVGVHDAVHGRRHGPPTMDDAIPWYVPWVPMAYSMDVHHFSNHAVVHGEPWTALRTVQPKNMACSMTPTAVQ